jgi:hypothetical protein
MDDKPPAAEETALASAPGTREPEREGPPQTQSAAGGEPSSGRIVGHLQSVAESVAEDVANVATAVEPIVSHVVAPVAEAVGTVFGAAATALSGRNALQRRLRRLNRRPLANLYELYPEARQASPRELGMRFVPLEDIRGTAVAGAAQRGSDFRPMAPFRGENWEARWARIRAANERLQPLPPVDLLKYGGWYWVLDGHNRVAAALYDDGAGLDAMVTELIPLDGHTSEQPTNLAGLLSEAGEMRAAAAGYRPAFSIRYGDQHLPDEVHLIDKMPADDGAHPADDGAHPADDGAHPADDEIQPDDAAAGHPAAGRSTGLGEL